MNNGIEFENENDNENDKQILQNYTLQFENKLLDTKLVPILFPSKFGVFQFTTINNLINNKEKHELWFMIDCSASMSDLCSDGKSKMQHILHTLKNMIRYFKNNSNVSITIETFNDIIHTIVERTQITNFNLNIILSKIDRIIPCHSTNIEMALLFINKKITQYDTASTLDKITNIFMTDGDTTCGNNDNNYLSQLINTNIYNAFIGFGIDHDSILLDTISSNKNCSYYFIDKLENAGLVYGEIIHSIMYKFLTNVEITITNGLIYNFNHNLWSNSLNVNDITTESNKTFHIISNNDEICNIKLTAYNIIDKTDFTVTLFKEKEYIDLTKYIFRQRTLELLYSVKNYLKYNTPTELLSNQFKQNLHFFIQEMKQYMSDNNLLNDIFMKNLCDDIYISHKTMNSKYANMYVSARQTSQGNERIYSVTNIPNEEELSFDNYLNTQNTQSFRFTRNNYTQNSQSNEIFDDLDNTQNIFERNISIPIPIPIPIPTNNLTILENNLTIPNSYDMEFEQFEHTISDCMDTVHLTQNANNLMREFNNKSYYLLSTNDV